ncbi:hypothetical protein BDZ97DRAFT_1753130 [Flammula alnicola]|nr:hypothetical protein BDZ97DRAFT_1753130 [Flammula alnicola]
MDGENGNSTARRWVYRVIVGVTRRLQAGYTCCSSLPSQDVSSAMTWDGSLAAEDGDGGVSDVEEGCPLTRWLSSRPSAPSQLLPSAWWWCGMLTTHDGDDELLCLSAYVGLALAAVQMMWPWRRWRLRWGKMMVVGVRRDGMGYGEGERGKWLIDVAGRRICRVWQIPWIT